MDAARLAASETADHQSNRDLKGGIAVRALRPGLRFKLLFMVVSVSLIIVAISSLLLFNFQRQQIIANTRSATLVLSNTIEAGLRHAMLGNERLMVDEVVQAVAAEDIIDTVRILDAQDIVRVSSVPDEIGMHIDQKEPACQYCTAGSIPTSNSLSVVTSSEGRQVLLDVKTIQNQPECHVCHSPENEVLGLLMVETSLANMSDQLSAGIWRTAGLAIATFALLIGLMIPALDRFVIKPVGELAKGVSKIKTGDLDYQVQVVSHDELGTLAESFNDMQQRLKDSHAEMVLREQELAILNEMSLAANQMPDLQEIMDFALDTVVNKLGMANGLIFLWDEAAGRYTLQASYGLSAAQIEEIDRRRQSGLDITRGVVESGKELFVVRMISDSRFHGIWDHLENRSYVNFPLMSRGTVVGVMALISPVSHFITPRKVDFLKAVGREIGVAIDNAILLADTQRREQEALTLYELGTNMSASLALSEVLNVVANAARELLNTDIGLVGLYDEEHQEIVMKAAAGIQANILKGMRIPVDAGSPGNALVQGEPIMVEINNTDPPIRHFERWITGEQISSSLTVPLERGERLLGLIEVMTRQPRHFLQRDAQLLMRLAHHVVVSIENAQLYRQLRYLAALEERDRLAREMHDHLAQALGYLNVKSSITSDQLSNGQIEQTQEGLLELKKIAKLIYTDVRESIFNLRTTVSQHKSMLQTLQEYLLEYRTHYGLDVRLSLEHEDTIEFIPEVASQILRIIQEALTNVRKHADADYVWICCEEEGDRICIRIEDNGRGFYPTQIAEDGLQHYGLQIMRERAESVGGTLELDSRPGQGTCVILRVPLPYQQEV